MTTKGFVVESLLQFYIKWGAAFLRFCKGQADPFGPEDMVKPFPDDFHRTQGTRKDVLKFMMVVVCVGQGSVPAFDARRGASCVTRPARRPALHRPRGRASFFQNPLTCVCCAFPQCIRGKWHATLCPSPVSVSTGAVSGAVHTRGRP
jgi:hypothetical protein